MALFPTVTDKEDTEDAWDRCWLNSLCLGFETFT
jgi:hypothetical protein